MSAITIPAGSRLLHVHLSKAAHLVLDNADTAPTGEAGVIYPASEVHLIPCRTKTHLHIKNATAGQNATITLTAFK